MSGSDSEAYRLAILASERLRLSLARHGLELPGVRGDHPSGGGEPMVELGRVSATVVHAVAELLDRLPLDGREAEAG
ncbi:hypothetical protein F7Q99_38680 [Streptomyces kaniharaensis]|uniref:Uncharacterized protein n=1 Tax=Streptomyces kaniharaensis TaxID=212423 RepID=A0A6N7L2F2_9ACTN|nr:hypothetical protein [Streptomyces kaniharaensis]MQS17960.1 hypothetical protein [Streptomyces kaniharaensis]